MLMRTDPFRELDRLTQQMLGTNGTLARPSVMPMDAWRSGDIFYVELDLPGVAPDSIELDVERNVVTVKAERPGRDDDVGARSRYAAWDHEDGEDAVYVAWHTNAPDPGVGTSSAADDESTLLPRTSVAMGPTNTSVALPALFE